MPRFDIAATRLANQHLVASEFTRPADVVASLVAVQAQEYDRAKWAIGLRMRSGFEGDVEAAMTSGAILRTHVLRPTWHFVTAADIRWLLALTGPRVSARMDVYNRKLELDASVFRRSRAVLARALRDGKQLTRQELKAALERAGLKMGTQVLGTQRLAHVMMQAELDGLICSGARRGKQFTYALIDERAPATRKLDRDEALVTLITRYVRTRGPATARDFSWWSGLTVADAKRGVEAAGRSVERVKVGDREYWMTPGARDVKKRSATLLLPVYDEYFMAYQDRSAVGRHVDAADARKLVSTLFENMVVENGQVVGSWKRTFTDDGVKVELRPLIASATASRRTIRAAAERYGAFFGMAVDLRDARA
jgi:hypothetical protein